MMSEYKGWTRRAKAFLVGKKIVDVYGSQSLVASIDYKKKGINGAEVFINSGQEKINHKLEDVIRKVEKCKYIS